MPATVVIDEPEVREALAAALEWHGLYGCCCPHDCADDKAAYRLAGRIRAGALAALTDEEVAVVERAAAAYLDAFERHARGKWTERERFAARVRPDSLPDQRVCEQLARWAAQAACAR